MAVRGKVNNPRGHNQYTRGAGGGRKRTTGRVAAVPARPRATTAKRAISRARATGGSKQPMPAGDMHSAIQHYLARMR